MKKIEMYSSNTCPYCKKAKQLLKIEGISYTEIKIKMVGGQKTKDKNFKEMTSRAFGQTTVPQIFIDGEYYGDDDTLAADIRKKRLKNKLT